MNLPRNAIVAVAALPIVACSTQSNFSRADLDHTGSVTQAEFDAYMKDEIFRRVDTNGDGKVSQSEWRAVNAKDPISEFRRVDRNGDGFISRAEADADFDRQGSLQKLFEKIDSNGNGTLSEEEVRVFDEKYRAAQGSSDLQKLSNAAES